MTEGVLLKRAVTPALPFGTRVRHSGGFSRYRAMQLKNRYAAACRRARNAARLQLLLDILYRFFRVLSRTAQPLRHVLGGFSLQMADRTALLRERQQDHRRALYQRLSDLTAVRPLRKIHLAHSRAICVICFAAAAVTLFLTMFYSVSLEVVLDGETLGYVTDQSLVEQSVDNVARRVGDVLETTYAFHPDIQYRVSTVRSSQIIDQRALEERLFTSVADIKQLYVLTVDGQIIGACEDNGTISDVLNTILAQYPVGSEYDSVGFVQTINIAFEYTDAGYESDSDELLVKLTEQVRPAVYDTYTADEGLDAFCMRNGVTAEILETLNADVDMQALLDGQTLLISGALPLLSVAQTRRVEYEVELAYETEYTTSGSLYTGDEKVTTTGKAGTALVTAYQMYMDGQVVGVNEVDRLTLTEPVTEVIAKGTKTRYFLGKFIRPYGGRVSSKYGWRSSGFHSGIDLAGKTGDSIKASDGGKVIFAGWQGSYGQLVIIEHDNTFKTLYAHCSKILVKTGQMVGQGEVIAKIGSTGRSTGPHLHFEIRVNNKHVNPTKYVKF